GEVVRQAHQHHGFNKRRSSNEIADAATSKVESLRHGARDHQLGGIFLQQGHSGWAGAKFSISFIDNHNARGSLNQGFDISETGDIARRIIWRGNKHHDGCMLNDAFMSLVDYNIEILSAWAFGYYLLSTL